MYYNADKIDNSYRQEKDERTIWDLKNELKEQATNIKVTRPKMKEMQRLNDPEASSTQWGLQLESWVYRHKHIAYCIERGTEYEAIEKPREGNEPDWSYIRNIREEFSHGA